MTTNQNDTTTTTPRTTEHGRHRRTHGPWHVWRSGRRWKIRRMGAAYLLVAPDERNLMEKTGAYAVECPACMVPAGERCTVPTETSRRPVDWVHFAREALAREEAAR